MVIGPDAVPGHAQDGTLENAEAEAEEDVEIAAAQGGDVGLRQPVERASVPLRHYTQDVDAMQEVAERGAGSA